MSRSWYGLIELFVVLLFVIGWGVLEWVVLHLDKKRRQLPSESRHTEG